MEMYDGPTLSSGFHNQWRLCHKWQTKKKKKKKKKGRKNKKGRRIFKRRLNWRPSTRGTLERVLKPIRTSPPCLCGLKGGLRGGWGFLVGERKRDREEEEEEEHLTGLIPNDAKKKTLRLELVLVCLQMRPTQPPFLPLRPHVCRRDTSFIVYQ